MCIGKRYLKRKKERKKRRQKQKKRERNIANLQNEERNTSF